MVSWPLASEPYWEGLPGSRALLHAIAEEPHDQGLRLILADWLDDHGEHARAEFIRAQVRLPGLPDWHPEQVGLEERVRRLLAENAERWLAGLPVIEGVCWAEADNFAGGLLERLHVRWGTLQREGERLFAAVDLRSLVVAEVREESEVAALAAQPWLARLASLDLSDNWIGDEGAAALAYSAHLGNLASLNLANNDLGDDGVAALACSPCPANLASLDLGGNWIGAGGAVALAYAPHLTNLASLDLGYNGIGAEGAEALAGSPYLGNLAFLDLGYNRIGAEGAAALARSAHLGNLASLDLERNQIGAAGAVALADSPHLANLACLNLQRNSIGGEVGQQLRARWPFVNL
jgi:uncharacterized protein (TIGR02996 family)